jgi:hypothetical protein
VSQAAMMVRTALPPADTCAQLGACPSSDPALLSSFASVDGPIDCPLCVVLITTLIGRLEDPESRAAIEDNARAACEALQTPAAQDKCTADVKALFDAVDGLLGDVDPRKVCAVIQFCGDESVEALLGAAPEAVARLQAAVEAARDIDDCDTCKAAVTQAAAILAVSHCLPFRSFTLLDCLGFYVAISSLPGY